VRNALKQLNILHKKLLDDDDLEISYPQFAKTPSDNVFNIMISWEFNVNNPEMLNKIVDQFDVFTAFLNTIAKI
jgi:hypothetical protein